MPDTNAPYFQPEYTKGQGVTQTYVDTELPPERPDLTPEIKRYPTGKPYRETIRARIVHDDDSKNSKG